MFHHAIAGRVAGALVLMLATAALSGCADEPEPAPLASGGGHQGMAPMQSSLRAFCEAGAAACDEVTEDECVDIVIEAWKAVLSSDLPCAREAKNCDDMAACLDALPDLPPVGDGGMPTTLPAE